MKPPDMLERNSKNFKAVLTESITKTPIYSSMYNITESKVPFITVIQENKDLIIILMSTIIMLGCNSYIEPELYLIPEDYIGEVEIEMNNASGLNQEYIGDYRVYRIDKYGRLKLNLKQMRDG